MKWFVVICFPTARRKSLTNELALKTKTISNKQTPKRQKYTKSI